MNEMQFWEYIDKASDENDFSDALGDILYGLDLDDIISFKNIFLKKLSDSYIFPLLAANFVISSYVSDDGFKKFRAWLVSKGNSIFQNAIDNPETIAEWLHNDEVDEIEGNEILYIADRVYIELGGKESRFYNKISFPLEPDMNIEWPENKDEFKRQYPKLVARFWNQERIEELHQ